MKAVLEGLTVTAREFVQDWMVEEQSWGTPRFKAMRRRAAEHTDIERLGLRTSET